MGVRADGVGKSLGESTTEVTARMTMAYAAALGETEPRYLDDVRQGGLVAPPPFCVVLEWPVMSGSRYRTVTGTSAEQAYAAIHVRQDSRFHRLVRPGDRLVTEGRLVHVRATSAGALVTSKLETRDAATAVPVVTSWFAAIFLRLGLDGPPTTLEEPPPLRAEPEVPTTGAATIRVPIARTLPHVYTECARIWNPIHTERAVALAAKLPDIILHGTATWALAAQRLLQSYAEGDPSRLLRIAGRFHGMVVPGGEIAIEHARDPERPGTVQFAVRNSDGDLAIAHGVAEFT
jgi:acyl dehydratase